VAEARVQRRLAAIFAADVVGYSRLMGEDEIGTLNALKELRVGLIDPAIREHRGRMVKVMGDGALVEFASVVDAVECAFGIQRAMADKNAGAPDGKQVVFRIGINLGDIIIEGRDIYGDGVNVAARLEGLAEPGGICISGTVFDQVKGKLDLTFDDLGPQEVKNIAEPVRVYRIPVEPNADTKLGAPTPDRELLHPDKPSVAVLPFDNLSNDPEQEYISDGFVEDLITDISKISGLHVISRNSSFAFKGQPINVKDIAGRLGVRNILEGSVRKMGSKLRINAQLIDAAVDGHIWAERYDGDMENIFEFQDAIREQIVSALEVSLTPTDMAQADRKPTHNVDAYDLFLKGRANIHRLTPEHMLEARKCLENAIEIDPHFADAHSYLSYCHFYGYTGMHPGFDDNLDKAYELAKQGVALNDTSAFAFARLGWIQMWLHYYDQAIANFEKALTLTPNNAEVYAAFGDVLSFWGDPKRGLEMIEKAFSLETFSPPLWEFYAGLANYLLRQYDEALTRLNQSVERAPKHLHSYTYLACTYVELDQLDNAREAIKSALENVPRFTVKWGAKIYPFRLDEDRNRVLGALRKAGLPEE
jgi:TolB-like protein